MRVALNIQPLGGTIRTGIFRVADHLACGMAQRFKNQLYCHMDGDTYGSWCYFQEFLLPQQANLLASPFLRLTLPVAAFFEKFISQTAGKRQFPYRIARKLFIILKSYVDVISSWVPDHRWNDIDIYHSLLAQIPASARSKHTRCFSTIYDLIPLTHPQYFERNTVKKISNIVNQLLPTDYVLCISHATRTDLLKYSKCLPERCFVAHLAASEAFYPSVDPEYNQSILEKYGIPEAGFLLSLCTFEIRKNIESTIRAFALLHEKKLIPSETKLVLVGGKGWKTQNIADALKAVEAYQDKILMPGFIPDEDLAAIYSSARVFVYLSLLEGFGLPPLEAMQCGTPVISSNKSSLPEVVGDGGIMLNPLDIESVCTEVARLYSDETFHAEMSRKALERSKQFSWQHCINQTIAAYEQALKSKQ